MRSFLVACVVLCTLLAVNAQDGYNVNWCLHSTTDTFSIYNVTFVTLNATHTNNDIYTMSSCGRVPCANNANCQICQYNRYCTATSTGGVYSTLPANYSSKTGYQMEFQGDYTGCPSNRARRSTVYVLCGQTEDKLVYLGEPTTCVYAYELYLKTACTFNAPPPTLTKYGQTSSSIDLQINIPDYMWNYYWLDRSYNVTMNGNLVYHGFTEWFDVDIPKAPTYSFRASAQFGRYISGYGQSLDIAALSYNSTEEELIYQKLSTLELAISKLSDGQQQIQSEVRKVEQQITVDVLPVVQHGDDQATANQASLSTMNTQLSNNVNNLDTKLTNQVILPLTQLQTSVQDKVIQPVSMIVPSLKAIDEKTETIQTMVQNITQKNTPSSPSASSTGAGWVFFGLFLGLAAGAVAVIAVQKYYLKIDLTRGTAQAQGYSNTGATNSFLGE